MVVLLVILALLLLLLLTPVGVYAAYGPDLLVRVRFGFLRLTVYPPKKRGKTRQKAEKKSREEQPAKLSQPALEVLAIIAYFQPVTRAYIEQIRGVDSSYTVGLLLERELIREAGRLAVPGRPMQFRTTKNFLRSFGLASLDDLPDLASASQEDQQLTLEMESALLRLQEAETGEEPEGGEEDQ